MPSLIDRCLFRPVDASSLAAFRILFGALMLFEAVNYGAFLCLDCLYREPELLFKYRHFEWVRLLPGYGLELVFVLMALAATGVMLGLFYRVSAVLLVVTFGYLFLLDQALYLNHFYLALLFAAILALVPAHRTWSLDARRRPGTASDTVPAWGRFWIGAQLEIVLIYAGLVKVNADWLNLEPMRLWMTQASADEAAVFRWLTEDWGIALASYGAIALHLVGAPLLLWRRTRLAALGVYAVFHTINAFVFDIGIFPWMTLAATLVLFDPDWPRQALRWLQARGLATRPAALVRAARPLPRAPAEGTADGGPAGRDGADRASDAGGTLTARRHAAGRRAAVVATLSLWLVAQMLVPLRHLAAPGDVAWNEDGHRFSWRMKLRSKRGQATFVVVRDDGTRQVVDPREHLTAQQVRTMACLPDLIWQYAQFLEAEYSEGGTRDVAVHVDARCSLNAREPQPLIDRLVDLTEVRRGDPVTGWVTPLSTPLRDPLF